MTTPFEKLIAGKAELVDGRVRLLPEGWAEFGPLFALAGIVLVDEMDAAEFSRAVRASSKIAFGPDPEPDTST